MTQDLWTALFPHFAADCTFGLTVRTAHHECLRLTLDYHFGLVELFRLDAHGSLGRLITAAQGKKQDLRATLVELHARQEFTVCLDTFQMKLENRKPRAELERMTLAWLVDALQLSPPTAKDWAAGRRAFKQTLQEEKQRRREAKGVLSAAEVARARPLSTRDADSFLAALEVRLSQPERISKALAMLRHTGFQLYHDVSDDALAGVVKSQTDPDLTYACRLTAAGEVCCCTQNLNVCGGLRGAACKHLLVLLIGLVRAGEVDPAKVDAWMASSVGQKPKLDRELMGDVFLRYRGAEAGELDWRPTETVPEDYYAY
ncbi:hypothetical protein [Pseudomarimonas arenosa]|uniref:SWIM-type domain-containing protein n=1 Tax=Pseudomarimonas arenosa TaxID=2774145 RepID=A0AAW3ZT45_9GAMM|nr:hypothetical protein [Pseudomarimonas arenosa]MBD8528010.1 hypothetical protein [Pseudomarimonas arenosa]